MSGNAAGSLSTGNGAGGGIYILHEDSHVQLTDVTVAGNTAGNAGGGIQNAHILVMNGGTPQNNRAGAIAGGLGVNACDYRPANGTGKCAGVGVGGSTSSGATISGNSAGGTFDCTTVPLARCTAEVGAKNHGVTVGACPAHPVTGEHCFSSNGYGGGVYAGASVVMTGGDISGNTAVSIGGITTCDGLGGGVFDENERVYMKDSRLANNTASCGGGDYSDDFSPINLYSVMVQNNSAKYFGVFTLEGASSIDSNSGGVCPNTSFPCS